jgi:phosphoserine phosphatase RsbU/P
MENDASSPNGTQSPGLLETDIFKSVAGGIAPVSLQPGDIPIRQGENSDTAYFLKSGSAIVYAETSYGPVTLATVHAPRLFGEIGVLAGLPRTASIRILTPSVVVPIPRQTLLEIGQKAPGILVSVIGELGRQIGGINKALGLYTNALAALEKREFDDRILSDLKNPTPELEEFTAAFRRFADQILHKRQQQDEMASAAEIQRSLLPDIAALQIPNGVDLHAAMRPARHVGGDFYDAFMLDDNRLLVTAGDVCGKGMPASLFMAVAVTVGRVVARQEQDLQTMVRLANSILCANNPSSMFATVLFGVLNVRSGDFEYCNSGHHPPLLVKPGGDVTKLPGRGLALAMLPDLPAQVHSAKLNPGDALIFITDGVTEAINGSGEEFGEARLELALSNAGNASAGDLAGRILSSVDAFAQGTDQFDDITCVAVRFGD